MTNSSPLSPRAGDAYGASRWQPADFAVTAQIAVIRPEDVVPLVPGLDLWDCWPLADEHGKTVVHEGRTWWFYLSAPCLPDPIDRHALARIRLLSRGADGWRDHGNALPDGLNPGTREWAGCAVLIEGGRVLLFYTVAGRRDGPFSFEQRLFVTEGTLTAEGPSAWQRPVEIVAADGVRYVLDRQEGRDPEPGTIKGFRDPAWFRDPATGRAHILFTASAGFSDDPHNGLIGMATLPEGADPVGRWDLGDPLIEAIGVNNELERPCPLWRDGRYYLFWSTQRHTFSANVVAGPNGLYGAVAESLTGPWRPLNGHGLVAANPDAEPIQSYSWWVTGEGEVWSFIDYWGMSGRTLASHPELVRAQFGGTAAPVFRLSFDGDRVVPV